MKPFVFQFLTTPTDISLDRALVEYDATQNLSVIRGTQVPAIRYANMDTETFTRMQIESSDTDRSEAIVNLLDTATHTLVNEEQVDSDQRMIDLSNLMITSTLTETSETTDQDK